MSIGKKGLWYLAALLLSAGISQAKEPKPKENLEVTVEAKLVLIDEQGIEQLKQQGLLGQENKGKDVPLLDNAQIIRFMPTAQRNGNARVMQAPRLTTLSGQHGTISSLEEKSFVTGLNIVSREDRIVCEKKTEIIPIGIRVDVQPTVSTDRRSICLDFDLKWNNLDSCQDRKISIAMPAQRQGNDFNGDEVQTATHSIQQPQVSKLNLNRSLEIPDKSTAVLMVATDRKSVRATVKKVPILGNLPYLGRLFRTVGYEEESYYLLVLLTPSIHGEPEEQEKP